MTPMIWPCDASQSSENIKENMILNTDWGEKKAEIFYEIIFVIKPLHLLCIRPASKCVEVFREVLTLHL